MAVVHLYINQMHMIRQTQNTRVRYWDKEGNYTDTNVQINDVDPRNASYLEMLAYTTYSDVEGFTKMLLEIS